jgi:aspartyl-tRNA(Asn)/glutamyl-tRNA(Gln) amidotransferase subunit A
MARTVEDLAVMMNIITQPDLRDWAALPPDRIDFSAGIDRGVRKLKLAFSPDLGFVTVDPEVKASVEAAVEAFERELEAEVELVDLDLQDCVSLEQALWNAGAASVMKGLSEEQRRLVDPGLVRLSAEGASLTAVDLLDVTSRRAELAVRMARFHQQYDLLLTPTLPIAAFSAGRDVPDKWPSSNWMSWTPFTYPFNLTQQPAATIPCGFTADGLPIGLQVIGPKFHDALVLTACRAFEQACPQLRRPPLLEC